MLTAYEQNFLAGVTATVPEVAPLTTFGQPPTLFEAPIPNIFRFFGDSIAAIRTDPVLQETLQEEKEEPTRFWTPERIDFAFDLLNALSIAAMVIPLGGLAISGTVRLGTFVTRSVLRGVARQAVAKGLAGKARRKLITDAIRTEARKTVRTAIAQSSHRDAVKLRTIQDRLIEHEKTILRRTLQQSRKNTPLSKRESRTLLDLQEQAARTRPERLQRYGRAASKGLLKGTQPTTKARLAQTASRVGRLGSRLEYALGLAGLGFFALPLLDRNEESEQLQAVDNFLTQTNQDLTARSLIEDLTLSQAKQNLSNLLGLYPDLPRNDDLQLQQLALAAQRFAQASTTPTPEIPPVLPLLYGKA